MQPPHSLNDGVVVLRKLREDDRAVILSTLADPLVRQWLNMPAEPRDSDFASVLRTIRDGFSSGERYDYCVTEPPHDEPLGAVIASRRHRENYERKSIWLHGSRADAIVWSLLPGDPR